MKISDTLCTLIAVAIICFTFNLSLARIYPDPHKDSHPADAPVLLGLSGAAAGVPVPGTGPRPPYVAELQHEIEARESELDAVTDQLAAANAYIQELANTLNGAIAERNEALNLLQQFQARRLPNL